jgi:hypothetical protein
MSDLAMPLCEFCTNLVRWITKPDYVLEDRGPKIYAQLHRGLNAVASQLRCFIPRF